MAQDERKETKPDTFSLGIDLFRPKETAGLDLYRGTPDLDQRAIILNRDLIVLEEGVFATPGTLRTLIVLSREQQFERPQYRSDPIAILNAESLVATINGLCTRGLDAEDPVSRASQRIQQAGQATERTTFLEAGLTPSSQMQSTEEGKAALADELFGELAERLDDDRQVEERDNLIHAIDAMLELQVLDDIRQRPDVLSAFLKVANEFSDPSLRRKLLTLQRQLEEQQLNQSL